MIQLLSRAGMEAFYIDKAGLRKGGKIVTRRALPITDPGLCWDSSWERQHPSSLCQVVLRKETAGRSQPETIASTATVQANEAEKDTDNIFYIFTQILFLVLLLFVKNTSSPLSSQSLFFILTPHPLLIPLFSTFSSVWCFLHLPVLPPSPCNKRSIVELPWHLLLWW